MKRILVTALSVLLIATMAIGGSVAYLTSTDSATNVFTMGDVEIEQIEQERNGEDGMKEFVDDHLLLPAHQFQQTGSVDTNMAKDEWQTAHGAVDKFVSVKNTGKTAAWVRTIFAFENTGNIDTDKLIFKNWGSEATPVAVAGDEVEIDGVFYNLYVYTYPTELQPNATTDYSLKQVAMAAQAGNDVVDLIAAAGDGKYTILAATQAVQAANMIGDDGEPMTAEEALNTAFYPITAQNNPWTMGEVEDIEDAAGAGSVIRISNAAQLKALGGKTIVGDTTIVIDDDIDLKNEQVNTILLNGNVKIVGNNHVISNGKQRSHKTFGFSTTSLFGLMVGTATQPVSLTVNDLTFDRFDIIAHDINEGTATAPDVYPATGAAVLVDYAYEGGSITLNNVTVSNSTIHNDNGDAAAFIGHSRSSVALNNCAVYNCDIVGETKTNKDPDADYNPNIKYGTDGTHTKSAAFVVTVNGWDQRTSGPLTLTIKNCKNGTDLPDWYRYFNTNQSGTASKTYTIKTADELVAFMEQVNGMNGKTAKSFVGETVVLMNDIDMTGKSWTPIGYTGANGLEGLDGKANDFKGTFDGNNHTIRNLTINNTSDGAACATGLFGFNYGMTVKNLTIDGANVSGHHWVGVIVGNGSNGITIQNCHVKNATVKSTFANANADGDKAGGIAGYINADNNSKIVGCSVENVNVYARRDAGYMVGSFIGFTDETFKDNTCTNCRVALYEGADQDYDDGRLFHNMAGGPIGRMY